MCPFARTLLALFLVVFVVTVSSARAPQSESDPAPAPATVNVNVNIDVLSNRHPISSYVYGGAYPKDAATITDSGLSVVRWGGNATSRYNWRLFTYNAANDWYFHGMPRDSSNRGEQYFYLRVTAIRRPV